MLALQKHHIIDLYVWVDDLLQKPAGPKSAGRPKLLVESEIITILIWNTLTVKSKTLKGIYDWFSLYHREDFPRRPEYKRFVENCHTALPQLIIVLNDLLTTHARMKIMDSTMLEVCKLVRADRHKVAANIADFGKNHQGWHYGFKLHAAINSRGQFCGLVFTPASYNDAQQMPRILNDQTVVAVGDGGYTASVMKTHIFKTYGTIVVTPPHPKQKKKVMAFWQYKLLKFRPKIESVFDYLKEHLHLVSSFPRSVAGYLLHYIRIILGYQIMAVSQEN